MSCESYKEALIQSATLGIESQSELRAHLAACASCRSAYAEEQSLFASIDAGLHKNANAEVPASLLPRVRARLDEEATIHRSWLLNWRSLAGAAAIVAVFFAAHTVWRTSVKQQPVEMATKTNPPSPVDSLPQDHNSIAGATPEQNSVSQPRTSIVRNLVPHATLAARNPEPEVLVPPDQEVVLARYAEQWRQRKHAPLVVENSDQTILAPLQVTPIQIAQLDVKLLAEEKSQ
jgi:hypothetical protein